MSTSIARSHRAEAQASTTEAAILLPGLREVSCVPPMISDNDLLAAVHTCGRAGDLGSLHDCLRGRVGLDFGFADLTERLLRLHRAGFVRVFQPHENDAPRYRLTQSGIERLCDLGADASKTPSN